MADHWCSLAGQERPKVLYEYIGLSARDQDGSIPTSTKGLRKHTVPRTIHRDTDGAWNSLIAIMIRMIDQIRKLLSLD